MSERDDQDQPTDDGDAGPDATAVLSESDIRPDALMSEQAQRYADDVGRLVGHKADFVEVPCPACGTDDYHWVFAKMGIDYVVCDSCDTMYVNPRPQPQHLEEYYRTSSNYAYWAEHIFPASEEARRTHIVKPRLDRLIDLCDRHRIRRDTLLEVGPGFGTFCEEAMRSGEFASVLAVEPTPDLAEACRQRGISVIEEPIEHVDLSAAGSPTVVVSFEAIEHFFDPESFLRSCAAVLPPDGLLVISCPSGAGFDVVTLGPRSDTVDAEHLNYFTPTSIKLLMERCGLEVVEVSTPGLLDAELVRKKAIAGEIDLADQPFLRQVLISHWERLRAPFQAFLADNDLSSHMWVAARPAR